MMLKPLVMLVDDEAPFIETMSKRLRKSHGTASRCRQIPHRHPQFRQAALRSRGSGKQVASSGQRDDDGKGSLQLRFRRRP